MLPSAPTLSAHTFFCARVPVRKQGSGVPSPSFIYHFVMCGGLRVVCSRALVRVPSTPPKQTDV